MRRRANRLMGGGRTVLFDSFTDVDGTPLTQHAGDCGVSWQPQPLTFFEPTIQSNRVAAQSVIGNGSALASGRLRRRNGRVVVDVARISASTNMELGALVRGRVPRMSSSSPYWAANHVPSANIWRLVRSNATVVGSTVAQTLTLNQVYRLEIEVRQSRIIVRVDGTIIKDSDDPNALRGFLSGFFLQNNAASAPSIVLDFWMATK